MKIVRSNTPTQWLTLETPPQIDKPAKIIEYKSGKTIGVIEARSIQGAIDLINRKYILKLGKSHHYLKLIAESGESEIIYIEGKMVHYSSIK